MFWPQKSNSLLLLPLKGNNLSAVIEPKQNTNLVERLKIKKKRVSKVKVLSSLGIYLWEVTKDVAVLTPPMTYTSANAVYLALLGESAGCLGGTLKEHFQKK